MFHRPSLHDSFEEHEHLHRDRYKRAEELGRHGHDCHNAFSKCSRSLIEEFSYLDEDE